MALWGTDDNLQSSGTVSVDYTELATGGFKVTGTGTTFGTVGFGATGNVIRFGIRGSGGTFFGDAVITGITSARVITIGSTEGLSGAAIASTDYYLSELPTYTVDDSSYSEKNSAYDRIIYGISTTTSLGYDGISTKYRTSGSGWVGVQTFVDCDGNFRVKSEILVAVGGDSGITTGANGIAYPTPQ
tara:strand:+ start:638 stop:1198 length:561 start_codon:yes stop_codon:yes gene_type:complete